MSPSMLHHDLLKQILECVHLLATASAGAKLFASAPNGFAAIDLLLLHPSLRAALSDIIDEKEALKIAVDDDMASRSLRVHLHTGA